MITSRWITPTPDCRCTTLTPLRLWRRIQPWSVRGGFPGPSSDTIRSQASGPTDDHRAITEFAGASGHRPRLARRR